ncbi:unnamed protein product [Schistosoma curassoni]|uniref:Rab3 GTPase-activating protein catalytic subunit n=1 Tax=Schistosoma curassoni TaxID=6186 RepID=A0A183K5Z3_9TREM|nr:unnamed protein product [Schistosoma curassoni]
MQFSFIKCFDELSQLFNLTTNTSDNNNNNNNDSPFIKYLQSIHSHQFNHMNPHSTSNNTSNNNNNVTVDETIHLFHLAWLTITDMFSAHETTSRSDISNDTSCERNSTPCSLSKFHIIFVANCPMSPSCLLFNSETNQNYKPLILKQYTFSQNSHEIINLEKPCYSSTVNSTSDISGRYLESSTSNNNNSHVVSGSSHYFLSERLALEILNNENIFNFTGIDMYSGGSSNENFFTLNPPSATVEDEINDDDDVDHDGDDSVDSDFSEIKCIPNIGVLSKGTEKLIELSDCYTFTFDTSLYELCLRSASDLAQEPVVSQILPSTIVNDLKHLYSPHIYSMRRSRFG